MDDPKDKDRSDSGDKNPQQYSGEQQGHSGGSATKTDTGTHYTDWEQSSNTRVSWNESGGKTSDVHTTDQNTGQTQQGNQSPWSSDHKSEEDK